MRAKYRIDVRISPLVTMKAKLFCGTTTGAKGPYLEYRTEAGTKVRRIWECPVDGEVRESELVRNWIDKRDKGSEIPIPIPQSEIDACGQDRNSILDFNDRLLREEIRDHAIQKTYLVQFDPAHAENRDALHRILRTEGQVLVAETVLHSNTRRPRLFVLEAREEDFVMHEVEYAEYVNKPVETVGEGGFLIEDQLRAIVMDLPEGMPKDKYAPALHALVDSKLTPKEEERKKVMELKEMVKGVAS